jgi:hypothetical protein
MNKQRLQAERLIYSVFDTVDPSGENSEFWKKEFSTMSDAQFKSYISKSFPFFYQTGAFKEPTMDQINNGLKLLNVPLLESIYLPYKYKDKDGNPMKTKECLVIYIHMKRMKQLLTKKNGMSINTKTRDMRTGLLTGVDKNGKESDHEFESLAISGLYSTMSEFSKPRADAMNDKSAMTNTIKTVGTVKLSDLPEELSDSLSKNLLSAYYIGAQLYTNLVNEEYMTPYTYNNKQKKIDRVD